MDIESHQAEIKSRKGSCSTLASPQQNSFLQDSKNSRKKFKNKQIHKIRRLRKFSSLNQETTKQAQEDLERKIVKSNKRIIFLMIKDIKEVFQFQIDTYLVCLKLTNVLKFNGEPKLCKHVAATIGFMIHKMYESYKLSFSDIQQWSGYELTKETFGETQAAILLGLNFELPSIDPCWTEIQIQQQISRIQSIYSQ